MKSFSLLGIPFVLLAACGPGSMQGDTPTNDAVTSDTVMTTDAPATTYSRYTEGTPPAAVTFTDVCNAQGMRAMYGNFDESTSQPITTPWAIRFYAGAYSTLRAHVNGFLSFSEGLTTGVPPNARELTMLPSTDSPNLAVYAMWEDLTLRDEMSICYGAIGTAPARSFIVQWNNGYYNNGTLADGNLTFQIRFNEADDTIDLLYQTVTPGMDREMRPMSSTIGVENEVRVSGALSGTVATQSRMVPSTGLRIRFTPMP